MILTLVIVIKRRGTEGDKSQNRQVMHSTTVHHLLTNAKPVPEPWWHPFLVTPPFYILGVMFYHTECLFGHFGQLSWPCSPSAFCVPPHWQPMRHWNSLTWGKHHLATSKTSVINIICILNLKQSTIPATRKKTSTIPAYLILTKYSFFF